MGDSIEVKAVLATAYKLPESSTQLEDSLSRQLAQIETVTEWFRMLISAPASAVQHGLLSPGSQVADSGQPDSDGEDDDAPR